MYLADHPDRRSFIYEDELYSHHFLNINGTLIRDTVDRTLPDDHLRLAAKFLEALALQCPLIAESIDFLISTNLYSLDQYIYAKEIIDAVFLENNRITRSDALFIEAV
jgi:hypothetical protein